MVHCDIALPGCKVLVAATFWFACGLRFALSHEYDVNDVQDQKRLAGIFLDAAGFLPSPTLQESGDPSMFTVICAHPTQWPQPSQVCAVTGNHSGTPFYGSFVGAWLPELCRVDMKQKACSFKASLGATTDVDLNSGNVTYLSGPGLKQPCAMKLTNANSTKVTLMPTFPQEQCPNGSDDVTLAGLLIV